MKFILYWSIFLASCFSVFAQGHAYDEVMTKNLYMLDTAQHPAAYQTLAAHFQRLGKSEKDRWLPYYYAALCQVRAAFGQENKKEIDPLVAQAEHLAQQADSLHPDKAEMLCLRALMNFAKIQVDPMQRGQTLGMQAVQFLEAAHKINPDNPRYYLLTAQMILHKPKQYGGGEEHARAYLKKAVQKFKTYEPPNKFSPDWGLDIALGLMMHGKE